MHEPIAPIRRKARNHFSKYLICCTKLVLINRKVSDMKTYCFKVLANGISQGKLVGKKDLLLRCFLYEYLFFLRMYSETSTFWTVFIIFFNLFFKITRSYGANLQMELEFRPLGRPVAVPTALSRLLNMTMWCLQFVFLLVLAFIGWNDRGRGTSCNYKFWRLCNPKLTH
jgi:hypothetical protein